VQVRGPAIDTVSIIPRAILTLILAVSLLLRSVMAQQPLPDTPKAKLPAANAPSAKAPPKRPSESGWPRIFSSGTDTFTMYPPQVDTWDANLITLYCAVELDCQRTQENRSSTMRRTH